MPKRPRRRRLAYPLASLPVSVLLWGSSLRKFVTTVCGTLIVIAGAITGTNVAWPSVEPGVPTWRGWVREHVHVVMEPVVLAQNQQAVAIDRYLQYQQQESLERALKDPAAQSSPIVRERIEELKRQLQETTERIRKAPTR